jgi:parallel beta-helix repeat protein
VRALRIVIALAFAAALVGAAVMSASGSRIVARHQSFNHHYPPDRATVERPKVHGKAPLAPAADTLSHGIHVDSLRALARHLPKGALLSLGGGGWLLRQPVSVNRDARLVLRDGSLELAPGTFLEARAGGTLELRGMSITGVDRHGRPLAQPVPSRAFLVGRDGGVLVLRNDRIRDLGHLGVVSYGIALRRPGAGSRVTGSTIRGNYFGVYLSHADRVLVAGNRISHSSVYGIDPYGYSRHITIVRNVVTSSGLHGIVLAGHVSASHVIGNTVRDVRGHGIVLYRGSTGNVVTGNRIVGSFDGIVLTDAPHNVVTGNRVGPVVRFGLRLSGASAGNFVERNTFSHSLLGAYLYDGASGNRLLDNVFSGNPENVRVRSDAPGNTVSPKPTLSEGVG